MLLFTLEGFSPAALSCYGSSFNRTEAIDSLASAGTVWDRVIASEVDPTKQIQRWLRDPVFPAGAMTLITDDDRIGGLLESDVIGESIWLPPRELPTAESLDSEATIEETTLAGLVAVAVEQLEQDPIVWLHSRFLTRAWDAPRFLYPIDHFDEDDFGPMDPSETIEHEMASGNQGGGCVEGGEVDLGSEVPPILNQWRPPDLLISPTDDPDWVMAWMRTYGCQIRLVDAMIEILTEVATQTGHESIVIAGCGGVSLGQNGHVGHRGGPLRSCHLHVPLITSSPGRLVPNESTAEGSLHSGSGVRDRRVMSADTITRPVATVLKNPHQPPIDPEAWAAIDVNTESDSEGQLESVVTQSADEKVAITTNEWFYVRDGTNASGEKDEFADTEAGKLFLKPDDISDVNDVARLRGEMADRLRRELE